MEVVESDFRVDLGDGGDELLVVNDAVSVLVGELDHLVDLSGREVLSDGSRDLLELLGSEGAAAGGVEGLEDSLKGAFAAGVAAEAEDVDEGAEVELASDAGGVHDRQDLAGLVLELEGTDGVHEFLDGDLSAAVVVEHVEHFFQFADRVSVQVLPHVLACVEVLSSL